MPSIHDAYIRHAIHYFRELDAANDRYIAGGGGQIWALEQFDREDANIRSAQRWLSDVVEGIVQESVVVHDVGKAALELCNVYPDGGAYLISLRLTSQERIEWLKVALLASEYLQRHITTQAHLGNLGLAYYELGRNRDAITYFEKAQKVASEINDRRHEGTWLGNIGMAYAALGEHQRAISYYEQHLSIAREIGDQRGEANALGNLGVAHAATGEVENAYSAYRQQLEIAREIGDQRGESNALLNIGLVSLDRGDFQEARRYFERCMVIARSMGDRFTEGLALGSLAHTFIGLDDYDRANEHLVAAIQIARQTGNRRSEVRHLSVQVMAYRMLGEYQMGIECGENALAIVREIESASEAAFISWQLGLIYEKIGDINMALDFFQANADYEKSIDHPAAAKSIAKIQRLRSQLE